MPQKSLTFAICVLLGSLFLANLQLAHTGEFWHALRLVQIIYYVRNRHFNADDKTNKKPYKSTSPRGVLTCKALISSYNVDIII